MKRAILLLVLILVAFEARATTYYVATPGNGGSDTNDGSSGSPWATIQKAADTMVAGDTVIVRDGTYAKFQVNASGTSGSPITYQAENPCLATVDGAAGGQEPIFIPSTVGWIVIDGFEVTNHDNGGISLQNTVHDVIIRRNCIHQIGFICTDTTGGIVGIRDKDDTTNVLVERNLFYDIKRLHPGESGCSPATTNWQNHDHGYYLRAQNATVINNVFLAHTGGWAIQLSPGANGFVIAHNTFSGANPNRDGQIVVWGLHDSFEISNNISFNAANSFLSVTADGGDPCGEKTNAVVRNNWITAAARDDQGGCAWTTVSGNQLSGATPQFVDAGSDDYHLTATSPVIGFGVTGLGVTTDYDDSPRDAAPDAGAFEFVPAATSTWNGVSLQGVTVGTP